MSLASSRSFLTPVECRPSLCRVPKRAKHGLSAKARRIYSTTSRSTYWRRGELGQASQMLFILTPSCQSRLKRFKTPSLNKTSVRQKNRARVPKTITTKTTISTTTICDTQRESHSCRKAESHSNRCSRSPLGRICLTSCFSPKASTRSS